MFSSVSSSSGAHGTICSGSSVSDGVWLVVLVVCLVKIGVFGIDGGGDGGGVAAVVVMVASVAVKCVLFP